MGHASDSHQENRDSYGHEEGVPEAKRKCRQSDTMSGVEALMALSSGGVEPDSKSEMHQHPSCPIKPTPIKAGTAVQAGQIPFHQALGATQGVITSEAIEPFIYTEGNVSPVKPRKRKRKEKEVEVELAPGEPLMHELPPPGEAWINLEVTLRNGKYKGRRAVVLGLAKKKYRVQVAGIDYQLEFYPSYVGLPVPPEGYVSHQTSPVKPPAISQVPQTQSNATALNPALTKDVTVSALQQTEGSGAIALTWEAVLPEAAHSQGGGPYVMSRTHSMASSTSVASKGANNEASSIEFREKHAHWVGETLSIQRGKYQGRMARILGLTSAKLQVSVPGVEHQLEYYPSMFIAPIPGKTAAAAAAAAKPPVNDPEA